jgi:hypothetical protein
LGQATHRISPIRSLADDGRSGNAIFVTHTPEGAPETAFMRVRRAYCSRHAARRAEGCFFRGAAAASKASQAVDYHRSFSETETLLRAAYSVSREEASDTPTSQSASPRRTRRRRSSGQWSGLRPLPILAVWRSARLSQSCRRARRFRVLGEIDVQQMGGVFDAAVGPLIVEAWNALGLLQASARSGTATGTPY